MKKFHVVLTLALALGLLVGLTTGAAVSAAYPGQKIQLPSINVEDGWSTWINAQNVGNDDTGAIAFFWGEYSGLCPPNSPGPAAVVCQRIVNNGVWTLRSVIPTQAKAAIIYSVDKDVFDEACQEAVDAIGDHSAWTQWKAAYQGSGQPLAAVVMRFGPHNSSSSYVGISEALEGEPPYGHYALLLKKEYQGQNAQLSVQNSGQYCVSVLIEYRTSDTCQLVYTQHFEALAPGEALHLKMEDIEEIPPNWLGTAFVRASQPLGVVVEHNNVAPTPTSTVGHDHHRHCHIHRHCYTYGGRSYKFRCVYTSRRQRRPHTPGEQLVHERHSLRAASDAIPIGDNRRLLALRLLWHAGRRDQGSGL